MGYGHIPVERGAGGVDVWQWLDNWYVDCLNALHRRRLDYVTGRRSQFGMKGSLIQINKESVDAVFYIYIIYFLYTHRMIPIVFSRLVLTKSWKRNGEVVLWDVLNLVNYSN